MAATSDATSDVKSQQVYDSDIRHCLHKEGDWYLIPQEWCFQYPNSPWDSLVFHVCPKSRKSYDSYTYTTHRFGTIGTKVPCNYCGQRAPESVRTLWILHNWNLLALND